MRSFHRGYKQVDFRPGEIIARVRLPLRQSAGGARIRRDYYRKVGTRRAQAISKVCFAGSLTMDGGVVHDVRIALGSVAPSVVRAHGTEAALRGHALEPARIVEAERALAAEISPIDDIRSTARYRARVAANLMREFLSTGVGVRDEPAR